MKANIAQIEAGVLSYIDEEFVMKLDGLKKWAVLSGVYFGTAKAEQMLLQLMNSPLVQTIGAVDENGMIDVDALKNAAMKAAEKTGSITQNIPMLGPVTFNATDVEKLYQHIQKQI